MSKISSKSRAVVIIPTYNERDNIQKVIPILLDVFKTVPHWDVHILVVDDTSPDKTYDVVEQLSKKYSQVHLLVNPTKAGLGGAYLKGMDTAFNQLKADVVFEFDADLSHDPTKIPEFLARIDKGYDLVLGSRYIPGGGIPDDWGLHRKFLSVVGNLVIMLVLTDFRVRDWTGGYRAITKRVYEAVHPDMHSERFTGYTFQLGFLHKALAKGFTVTEVPFKFVDRTIGESKLGAESIKNTLMYICKVRLQQLLSNRIFKFAMVGGTGAAIQLLSLTLYRNLIPTSPFPWVSPFQVATALSIETAIVSNFILNNGWTFADRQLPLSAWPGKFLQFNAASLGSVLIQLAINTLGELSFGLQQLFSLTVAGFTVGLDLGTVYAVIGILVGMFWNFFAYSKLVWKAKR